MNDATRPASRLRLLVPLALMGLIWWESSHSLPIDLPHQSDKLAHAGAFGVLALSWFWALGWPARSFANAAVIAAGVSVLWGVVDELHQSFVPQRDADVFDALSDTVGAIVAVGAAAWLARRLRARRVNP